MRSKYQFWLIQNTKAIRLPVLPDRIKIGNKSQNASVNVDGLGEVTIPQSPNLFSFQFNSELPVQYYDGCEYYNIPDSKQAFQTIQDMKNSGPLRFIVTGTFINYEVTIEDFGVEERGGDIGTLYYNLQLLEYRKPSAKQVTVKVDTQTKQQQATISNEPVRTDNRPKAKTYTVKKGDYLYKIAASQLGSGSKWKEIASLNNIKPKYVIYPNQVLQLPS